MTASHRNGDIFHSLLQWSGDLRRGFEVGRGRCEFQRQQIWAPVMMGG